MATESRGAGQESSGVLTEMKDEECSFRIVNTEEESRRDWLENQSLPTTLKK